MSWETKTEYCGLTGTGVPLECKGANLNNGGQYLEKLAASGAYATAKPFGVRAAPSNDYTIKGTVTISGKSLGAVKEVDSTKYALESIRWTTGADAEPTLSATAKQVEANAATSNVNKFRLPRFSISQDHVAQIPAFVWNGDTSVPAFEMPTTNGANAGCELLECGGEFSCTVKTNDVNGDAQWHDVTRGHVVVDITIAQYGDTAPTVEPASGWDVSSPLSCDDPDSDFPTWKMQLTRKLSKEIPSRSVSAAVSASPGDGDGDGDGEGEQR